MRGTIKNLIAFRFLILIINLIGNNSKMTNINDVALLEQILKDDIVKSFSL